jgi:cytochrome c
MVQSARQGTAALAGIVGLLCITGASAETVSNQFGPALNYTMACSGCHMADGSGFPGRVPTFRGAVARYLAVPEGRAYLVRVPGSANSFLSSRDLAEVLNWTVYQYDAEHLPANFEPYRDEEVARLRSDPLSAGSAARAHVMAQLAQGARPHAVKVSTGAGEATPQPAAEAPAAAPVPATAAAASPPAAFAICTACHTTSSTGENSIGPNLRGVIGRPAGTAPSYSYTKAMRDSGIVWSKAEIESFLTDTATKVPGTQMAFPGLADPQERAAVADYLESLK